MTKATVVHVRANGRSDELTLVELGIQASASDQDLKHAVARYLDRPEGAFNAFEVVRTREAIIIRPEAIYG